MAGRGRGGDRGRGGGDAPKGRGGGKERAGKGPAKGRGEGAAKGRGEGAGKVRGEGPGKSRGERGPKSRGKRSTGGGPPRPGFPDQLEGRNLVLAALKVSSRVRHIWIDERAGGDKIDALRAEAEAAGVRVTDVPRSALDDVSDGAVHNGVIGFADGLPNRTLRQLLDEVFDRGESPFFVLLDQVQYEQNLGAILRTAAAAGVHGVIVPTRRGASLTPTAQRIAMGGAEEVPVVREGMMSALATLRRAGVRIVGTEAGAPRSYTEIDLTGAVAIVMGGEDRGLSSSIAERCDAVASIPMRPSLAVTSLNVSVSTALLLYERVRQEGQALAGSTGGTEATGG